MYRNKFQEAISPNDIRLQEPHIGVLVVDTPLGPMVPLIKRRKYLTDKNKNSVLDEKGKPAFEEFFDLPGGKRDAILINGIIRGVEPHKQATAREFWEETGLFVEVGDRIASGDHPFKNGLLRHFNEVTLRGGTFHNKVPDEHDYAVMMEPEAAIFHLKGRVPEEVEENIRDRAKVITKKHELETIKLSAALA